MADATIENRTPNLALRYKEDTVLNLNWERIDEEWGRLVRGEIPIPGFVPGGDTITIINAYITNAYIDNLTVNNFFTVNGDAIFHGDVTFDGDHVTIVNELTVLGDTHLHNLDVDNITINAGGTFNCGGTPVVASDCIVSLDWVKLYNVPDIITQIITNNGMAGLAGGDLTDSYPNPHLIPSGVTPGLYGDAANIPRITVDAKGRLTNVTLVPFVSGGGGSPLGAAGGDLAGTYPNPTLVILPSIPAGVWGAANAIPQLAIDPKGRVTHATHTVIRPGRDGMAPVYVTRFWPEDADLQLGPNTTKNLFLTQFTPIATGRGRLHGSVSGFLFNTESNPDVGTLHTCWVNVYVLIDGVQVARVRRSLNLWEPADGHAVSGPVEIPFSIPWTQTINQTHQVTVQVRNFRNYTEVVDPVYPMSYQVDWTALLIEEESEPGLGSSSSYLLAGAVAGGTPTSVIGSWIATLAFTLPAGLAGSQANLKVAGATTNFDIQVNGVSKGQIHWTAGQTLATFIFPAAVSIAVGDRIEVVGAAGVSDPTWTLRGLL
jgi:hypothetical protein